MALSQKNMELGPFYLGAWIYDCSALISQIKLAENRPALTLKISLGEDVGKTIAAGLSALPGDIGQKVGDIVKKNFPQVSGKITIIINAQPMTKICHEKDGKKVQIVGWDSVLFIHIEGKIKTAAATVEGTLELPFIFEGDREECGCNEQVSYNDKLDIGKREITLLSSPKLPLNISANDKNFAVAYRAEGFASLLQHQPEGQLKDTERENH